MRKQGQQGNVVRLELRLAPSADLDQLSGRLMRNEIYRMVRRVRLARPIGRVPYWYQDVGADLPGGVELHTAMDRAAFEATVLNRDLSLETGAAFIDLVACVDGSKRIVISAHHALFDQRGMVNLAKALDPEGNGLNGEALFPEVPSVPRSRRLKHAVQVMYHMLGSPFWYLARLWVKGRPPLTGLRTRVLRFSLNDTQLVDRQAWAQGARLGRSHFHLAATTMALRTVFAQRREHHPYFWVSMPLSRRPRGVRGHLMSNQLSFVFVRMHDKDLASVATSVASINGQIKEQIAAELPAKYVSLLEVLRHIPLWWFSAMVNLPMRGAYASFAFSDIGEDQDELRTFAGVDVLEVLNYPPAPCPPGLTITFMRHAGELKVVLASVEEAISAQEMGLFERQLNALLRTGEYAG
ncbi:MAG: hypothetical protein IPK99_18220 [Flavobacteriales bacterium]|nr:hypothetical protein [Flavobacteriales bacterium]